MNPPPSANDGCPICAKHRGEGPLVGPVIYTDELVFVAHRATGALGYVFVETRRHAPHLEDLTDAEAEAVGRVTTQLARGLRAELGVDFVHTAVAGLYAPHFHQHVFVRHPGTPQDHPWWPEWSGAPHGDNAALADRLRSYVDRA